MLSFQNDSLIKLAVVFCLKLLLDVIDYFIFYDFYFFKNLDFHTHGQAISYYLEFGRILKRTLIFGLGIHTSTMVHWVMLICLRCFSRKYPFATPAMIVSPPAKYAPQKP